ncbi:MAG: RimK family alpha-L-glutamate ligase [Promethearchaeota archaeon]
MKIGIEISSTRQKLCWHERQLKCALEKKAIPAIFFPIKDTVVKYTHSTLRLLYNDSNLIDDLSCVLVRGPGIGLIEQIYFRMNAIRLLEHSDIYVVNSATSIERASDKLFTSMVLDEAGILVPPTIVAQKIDEAMNFFRNYKDIVIKPLFGSKGMGLTRITNEETAYLIFEALEQFNFVFYLQKFIPHGNRDIRALVIGDQVVAAMYRVAEDDDWKTNVSRGASPKRCDLNDELKELCIKSAQKVGCEIAGIDIMIPENEVEEDYYIIEVNSCPAWEGLQNITHLNIAEAVIEYLVTKLKQ